MDIKRTVEPAWTILELMKHWKISRNTLVKIVASGELVFMDLGAREKGKRFIRVRDEDRLAFEKNRELNPGGRPRIRPSATL